MNILEIYDPYLKAIGFFSDKDGFIKASIAGDVVSLSLKGKSLVLPTDTHLRNPNKEKTVFHPLYENVVAKSNPMLDLVRLAMVTRVNTIATVLFKTLMRIASSPALHKDLNPEQCAFLKILPEVHKDTLEFFDNFIDKTPLNVANQGLVSIYVKTGGIYKGIKHSKVAVVSFPVYEDINSETPEFVKCKKARDKKTLNTVLEYIFPNIAEKASYSYGSTNETSPYNCALFGAYKQLADALNEKVKLFADKFEHVDELLIDTEINDLFKEINTVRNIIHSVPMQDDPSIQTQATVMASPNEVKISPLAQKLEEAKRGQIQQPTLPPGIMQPQPIVQAPVGHNQSLSFTELQAMARNNAPQVVQPVQQIFGNNQQPQMMNGWGPAPGTVQPLNLSRDTGPSWLSPDNSYFRKENQSLFITSQNSFGRL